MLVGELVPLGDNEVVLDWVGEHESVGGEVGYTGLAKEETLVVEEARLVGVTAKLAITLVLGAALGVAPIIT